MVRKIDNRPALIEKWLRNKNTNNVWRILGVELGCETRKNVAENFLFDELEKPVIEEVNQ